MYLLIIIIIFLVEKPIVYDYYNNRLRRKRVNLLASHFSIHRVSINIDNVIILKFVDFS